jgi:hypothetical protein
VRAGGALVRSRDGLLNKHSGRERGNTDGSLLPVEAGLPHERVNGIEQYRMQMQVHAGQVRVGEVDG